MTESNSEEPTLIDSNILVYAYEKEESERKNIAKKIIAKAFEGKARWHVSAQNIAEFAAVYMGKKKGDKKKLERSVRGLIMHSGFIKVCYSSQTISAAIALSQTNTMPFWDALIAATMLENNITRIYTENTADFNVPGITPINPFKSSSVKV